uniref:Putative c2h2-type zn-finger protein n=1 Tax=Culex tarsalis TaxID=7177 RepID=A0A1Q3EV92_CULTA
MAYRVDRTFDNEYHGEAYSMPYSNGQYQVVYPPFSNESVQNLGLYYEQESTAVIDTVLDYEQPTVYYTSYTPQQSDGFYADGPTTVDREIDQLLQQYQGYHSGAYTKMEASDPSEQDKLFGQTLPEDEITNNLLEEVIKNEELSVALKELQQYDAAVVSPLDSGCSSASSWEFSDSPKTTPQREYSPASFQELFDSVAEDEAQSTETVPIMYIDENKPTVSVAPTKTVRKRGRKPLPKAPVTNSEFHCLPCNKVFKRHRGLLQHNHYHHSGPKEHLCTVCGKKYPTVERLQTHVQKHNDAFKAYGCQHCTKRFSKPFDMKRHIWTSHGEAPFSCSYCDKRFGRLDHVEQHELSHKNKTVIRKK